MHSLLTRQLRRHFGSSEAPPGIPAAFLEDVERAYQDFDSDRRLLERSVDLSSAELGEAHAALQGILQALPDTFIRMAGDGTILECRGGADDAFGCPPHALIGTRIQDVSDPPVRAALEQGIGLCLRSGSTATVEYVPQEGLVPRAYEARIVPVPEGQVVVVVRDVTARHHAEEENGRQQAFVRHVVDLNPSLICAKDGEGRITFANEAMARAYRCTVEVLLGRTERELGRPPDEVAACLRHEQDVLRAGIDAYVAEESFTAPGARVRWLQTFRRAIPGPDGQGTQVLSIATDISELLRAEHEMRQRSERLQARHNALHDLVIHEEGDVQGQIGRILAAAAQETDVDRVSVWRHDRSLNSLVRTNRICQGAMHDGGKISLELSRHPRLAASASVSRTIAAVDARLDMRTNELTADYLVPEGIISLLVAPIRQDGELIGFIYLEVPDRPRRWTPEDEQFMASIADLLALAMAGGKRRLLEQQLLQAQKMEAIGSLAAGVAHDFNNLLSAIIGFADLTLKRLAADAPVRRSVEQIVKAAHRGGSLTRQLLMFSRRQPLPPQILDLNAIVRDMEPMLRRLIGENVTIHVDLDRHAGQVLGDAGQMEQVLLNLVVNARDAMSGGGAVWITTRGAVEGTERLGHPSANGGVRTLVLSVRDSGMGMTPETQARIFEPFYTTKPTGQGSGLGLSTVYGIVQQMGGDIRVESAPGRGSTFAIYLPEADAPVDLRPSAPRPEIRPLGGGETILVVEDDEQLLTLAVETLSHHGYRVVGAATGLEGLLLSEQETPHIDLMVVDIAMPYINGPDLIACARQTRPDVKVLFMSAVERSLPEAYAGDEARTGFIQKPFMPDDFVGRIRELLDGSARAGSPPAAGVAGAIPSCADAERGS